MHTAVAVCLAKTHFPCGLERLRQIYRDSRRKIAKLRGCCGVFGENTPKKPQPKSELKNSLLNLIL